MGEMSRDFCEGKSSEQFSSERKSPSPRPSPTEGKGESAIKNLQPETWNSEPDRPFQNILLKSFPSLVE